MNITRLVFDTFKRRQATHGLFMVWLECWTEARRGPAGLSNGHIAQALGLSRSHVRKCLRILGCLDLVHARAHGRDFDLLFVRGELRDEARAVLHDLAEGRAEVTWSPAGVRGEDGEIDLRHAFVDPGISDSRPSYIYVLENPVSRRLKIGTSRVPDRRQRDLEAGAGGPLNRIALVPGDYRLERELHTRFAAHRVAGEWFEPHEEVVTWLHSLTSVPVAPCAPMAAPSDRATTYTRGVYFIDAENQVQSGTALANVVNKASGSVTKDSVNTDSGNSLVGPLTRPAGEMATVVEQLVAQNARLQAENKRLRDGKKKVEYAPEVRALVDRILLRWKDRTGHTRITDAMRRTVHARLTEGFTEDEFNAISDWVVTSDWHQRGVNPQNRQYNSVAFLFGNEERMTKYLGMARGTSRATTNAPSLMARPLGSENRKGREF